MVLWLLLKTEQTLVPWHSTGFYLALWIIYEVSVILTSLININFCFIIFKQEFTSDNKLNKLCAKYENLLN